MCSPCTLSNRMRCCRLARDGLVLRRVQQVQWLLARRRHRQARAPAWLLRQVRAGIPPSPLRCPSTMTSPHTSACCRHAHLSASNRGSPATPLHSCMLHPVQRSMSCVAPLAAVLDDSMKGALHGCREAATGRGVVFATRELLKASGAGHIADKTFVIQACAVVISHQYCPPCTGAEFSLPSSRQTSACIPCMRRSPDVPLMNTVG